MFKNEPRTDLKKKKKIQEIIGTNCIENGRIKKDLNTLKEGKYRSKAENTFCRQKKTTTIKSQQANKICKIF